MSAMVHHQHLQHPPQLQPQLEPPIGYKTLGYFAPPPTSSTPFIHRGPSVHKPQERQLLPGLMSLKAESTIPVTPALPLSSHRHHMPQRACSTSVLPPNGNWTDNPNGTRHMPTLNIYAANFMPTATASAPPSSIHPSPNSTPDSSLHSDACQGESVPREPSASGTKIECPLTPASIKETKITPVTQQHSAGSSKRFIPEITPVTPVNSQRRRNRRNLLARPRK
ncbi:uncharacterized protein BROUX77_004591 [Berkeleyomyces rouxiae]|uniref:uncharacterized protein n=1 Tax=Berkeleyomyces rouxiae TaxID=2035830 RepID=UPI003B7F9CE4